jgi:hypothetical protein
LETYTGTLEGVLLPLKDAPKLLLAAGNEIGGLLVILSSRFATSGIDNLPEYSSWELEVLSPRSVGKHWPSS